MISNENKLFLFRNSRRAKEDIKQKLKEITNLRLQSDRNHEESTEYRRKIDLDSRDIKRLQDDLASLARQNHVNDFHH